MGLTGSPLISLRVDTRACRGLTAIGWIRLVPNLEHMM